MSRSFKHVPMVKDYNRGMKALANRQLRAKIRRGLYDDVLAGKSNRYRRLFSSWDISDYAFRGDIQKWLQPRQPVRHWGTYYRLDGLAADSLDSLFSHPFHRWETIMRPLGYRHTNRVPRHWHPLMASDRAWRVENDTWSFVQAYLRK